MSVYAHVRQALRHYTNGRLAVGKDGKIVAAEYDVGLDHGAYGVVAGKIFNNLVSVGFHGYNVPSFKGLARGVATNHGFNAAYRGFGAPQIYTCTDALIDMAAEKLGMDPWSSVTSTQPVPATGQLTAVPITTMYIPHCLKRLAHIR
jgi:aldehyde oxidoreductase